MNLNNIFREKIYHQTYVVFNTLLIIVAFSLRVFYWHLNPLLSRDAMIYLTQISAWQQAPEYASLYWGGPPLYLFLVKQLLSLGIPIVTAGVGINLVAGSFIPLVGYGIAKEVTNDKRLALCCAVLFVVHPSILTESITFQRDTLYLLLIGTTIYFLIRGIRRSYWFDWCFTGGTLSLATMVRYESLEMLPVIAGTLLFAALMKYFTWRKTLLFFCLATGSMLVIFFILILVMGINQSQYNQIFNLYGIIYERILFFKNITVDKGT